MIPRLVHIVVVPTACSTCAGGDVPRSVFLCPSRAWEFAKRIPGATVLSREVYPEQTSVMSWARRIICLNCLAHDREDLLLFERLRDAWRASQEVGTDGEVWVVQQVPLLSR